MMLEHGAWAVANLGVPFLLPIIFVKFVRVLLPESTHSTLRKRLRLTYLFREGQYALTSLAVSTAALYELMELGEWSARTKLWLAVMAVLSLIAVTIVVVGLMTDTDDPERVIPPGSGIFQIETLKKWCSSYRAGAASIILIAPVSFLAYQGHEASVNKQKYPQVSRPAVEIQSTPPSGE